MEYIIETKNISKYYKNLKAVDNVSIGIKKGEIYGFMGLNGAGKTTTIKLLLGMISPTSGEAYINGEKINPNERKVWEKVGYLVEIPYSYPELTVKENLLLFCKYRKLNYTRIDEIIDLLKLSEYKNVKASRLSQGNYQRLGIAKALIHNPEILILDEPANGLDPLGIVELREILKDLAFNQGKTIFISSHILSEISKIATRIGIIHKGKLIKELDINQLEKERIKKLLINTKNNQLAYERLRLLNYNIKLNQNGYIEVLNDDIINKPEIISNFIVLENKIQLCMLKLEEEGLEDYFIRIIHEMEK